MKYWAYGKLPCEREYLRIPGVGFPREFENVVDSLAQSLNGNSKLESRTESLSQDGATADISGGIQLATGHTWAWQPSNDAGGLRKYPYTILAAPGDNSSNEERNGFFQNNSEDPRNNGDLNNGGDLRNRVPWQQIQRTQTLLEETTQALDFNEIESILEGANLCEIDEFKPGAEAPTVSIEPWIDRLYPKSGFEGFSVAIWEFRSTFLHTLSNANLKPGWRIQVPLSGDGSLIAQLQLWIELLIKSEEPFPTTILWGKNWSQEKPPIWAVFSWDSLSNDDLTPLICGDIKNGLDLRSITRPTQINGYQECAREIKDQICKSKEQ